MQIAPAARRGDAVFEGRVARGLCLAAGIVVVCQLPAAAQTGAPAVRSEVTGQLGATVNNPGLQQTLGLSVVRPLSASAHPLVRDAHLSTGVETGATPAQGRIGAWFEVAPLSIVQFRAGVDRAFYFGTFNSLQSFDSYSDPFDSDDREARGGAEPGSAWRLYVAPAVRLKFGPVVVASTAELEQWESSAAGPYFYEPTRDTLLASSGDSLLTVSSVVLLQRQVTSGTLSLGVIHQALEAPSDVNDIEKYGVIGIREFTGRRFRLPNPRLTLVIAHYAADPWKKGQWTAAAAVAFTRR